jgi:hypothetical protein
VLGDITLRKTGGQHGSDRAYAIPQMAERLGDACGLSSSIRRKKRCIW